MAVFPCDLHGGRYRGPAAHLYASWYAGTDGDRQRFRICQDDLNNVLVMAADDMVNAGGDSDLSEYPAGCARCGKEDRDVRVLFYLTVFSAKDRWDFFQVYCSDCAFAASDSTLASQLWARGAPRRAADLIRSALGPVKPQH